MGCMVLCRTFHTAPEQGQRLTPIVPHSSGSGPVPVPVPTPDTASVVTPKQARHNTDKHSCWRCFILLAWKRDFISISHLIDPLLSQVFEREHERVSADRPTVRSLQRP